MHSDRVVLNFRFVKWDSIEGWSGVSHDVIGLTHAVMNRKMDLSSWVFHEKKVWCITLCEALCWNTVQELKRYWQTSHYKEVIIITEVRLWFSYVECLKYWVVLLVKWQLIIQYLCTFEYFNLVFQKLGFELMSGDF